MLDKKKPAGKKPTVNKADAAFDSQRHESYKDAEAVMIAAIEAGLKIMQKDGIAGILSAFSKYSAS